MNTFPPTERMVALNENMQLNQEINQIREEQQNIAQDLEPIQELSFKVIEELVGAQDSVDKLKNPITA